MIRDENRRRQRPYFIWDYDLTEAEVRAILRSDDPLDVDAMLGFYQQLADSLLRETRP